MRRVLKVKVFMRKMYSHTSTQIVPLLVPILTTTQYKSREVVPNLERSFFREEREETISAKG